MHNECWPVVMEKLFGNMTCHIVVDLNEILYKWILALLLLLIWYFWTWLTDTKKLVVPSALSNIPGKSLIQVSSPYMTSCPSLAFNWASHVSWCASVEDVSDSAMFKITSRNDGTDPVVMAFNRGIVTVGELAWPVKGSAAPDRIKLYRQGQEVLEKMIKEQLWYPC